MDVKAFSDVVAETSEKSKVKRSDVQKVLMALRDVAYETITGKMIFRFRDLGNVRLIKTEKRMARNPQTGDQFEVAPGYRVKYSRGSAFDLIVKGKAKPTKAEPKEEKAKPEKEKTEKKPEKPAKGKPEGKLAEGDQDELEKLLEEED